jgi:glycosyltransferase involved in cell wall biosynthesis
MKNSLFTVCSSFTEGLPVVSMESICLGVPIVSSYPSVSEIFGNEQCGIITENDDDSLYDGIYKMLTDSEFYNKALASTKEKSNYFSGERMVREVENIYCKLLEE